MTSNHPAHLSLISERKMLVMPLVLASGNRQRHSVALDMEGNAVRYFKCSKSPTVPFPWHQKDTTLNKGPGCLGDDPLG